MLIDLKSLSLTLHQRALLCDVNLSLPLSESLALVGPNGAGKTSLLRVLCGLYRQYSGSAKILNHEVNSQSIEDLSKLVSLVPQRMEFLPAFTVSEYMELSAQAHSKHLIDRISHLISDLAKKLLPELSGGELQRVIIAGAVAQGVKLLLLDEPTSNLDPQGRNDVEHALLSCRKDLGVSYLLVTHDISFALRCCDNIAVLSNGRLQWCGCGSDDLRVLSELESAYGCGFVRMHHEKLGHSGVVVSV
jgi:ABC-type multidrug transport system ATPase subunit